MLFVVTLVHQLAQTMWKAMSKVPSVTMLGSEFVCPSSKRLWSVKDARWASPNRMKGQ